jgi:hypothetical protein
MQGDKYYKDCIWYPGSIKFEASKALYDTSPMLGKFCMLDPQSNLTQSASKQLIGLILNELSANGIDFAQYMNDLNGAKYPILISMGSAFLIGFIYLIVLRLCGGPIVYLSLLLMVAGGAAGGVLLFFTGRDLSASDPYKQHYLIGSYVAWGITGLFFCCILCNFRNIKIGVSVFKCTAQFVGSTPQIFLIPPVFSILLMAWMIVFIVVSLFILSIGTVEQRPPPLSFLGDVKRS